MRRSLRYNGLFRSFSNYRVDNKGFDSREPARSRAFFGSLRVLSIWKQDGRKNETLKKDETRKRRLWQEDGKIGRRTKRNTRFNWAVERNMIAKNMYFEYAITARMTSFYSL